MIQNKQINDFCFFILCNFYEWIHKHFLWTIWSPYSWYSALVIHIFWNVDNEDKIEPPIHAKNFLSWAWEANTLTFVYSETIAVISLVSLYCRPGNIVEPPLNTMFLYKSFLISTSHLRIDWWTISWIPGISLLIKIGLKRTSGHLNFSLPKCTVWPSGS